MNAEADFIQAERILRIETSLGEDQLLAQKLWLREAVSELFEARMVVRSKSSDLTPQDLLGKAVDVSIELGGGERRAWNAIVTDLMAGARQTRGLREYTLTLRPDLWLLSQTSDCRIWLDKSAIDIANDLCGEHGITAPVIAGVVEPVPPQHYSVQWNESDLDYLTRRLEEDGLYYWWTHESGAHQLHIASHAAGYIGGEDVRFAHGSTDRNHINRFETRFRYIPGNHAGRDWNFTTPGTVPDATTPSLVSLPKNGNYERYTYPMQAGYGPGSRASEGIETAGVERVAKLRMKAQEAEHARVEGDSNVRTLAAGSRFTPYDVANPDNVFEPHVILAIEHEATDLSYESVENQPDYANRFVALPADVPATPSLATPRPRIDGTQVAIVAGPEGEEIHTDEYGRIKLWFPWDRRATQDGSDTCWVRVAQNWAGAGWGGQVIPRIGMEVMVSYLDGDPDRPVVTGVVPNQRQKVPYDLPEHKTRSTFRTNTHKGSGFNELRFEDKAGEEEIRVHAERDLNVMVRNNKVEYVSQNKVATTLLNAVEQTFGFRYLSAMSGLTISTGLTGASQLERLGIASVNTPLSSHGYSLDTFDGAAQSAQGLSLLSEGNRFDSVGENSTLIVDGNARTQIRGTQTFSVAKSATFGVGENEVTSVGGTSVKTVGKELLFSCGKSRLKLKADGTIELHGVRLSLVGEDIVDVDGARIDLN
ncbi:type VI secretion system tip protein TssI/VgrG [Tateyamaria sp. ANG-S1]|uniref:type VI secretion system Vgr family protein n=1 Tax=Tateyamaria sp. ANG-S1 TaxID=1577905 RepID=UPI0005802532|nr:type VI secretion system tip protein TssI/VgrG [Tateyamaria sp. ANG-S1]KIC45472.1 hypothetical protein RA29_20765 [Tateyamaria sp. ANG-S1]